MDSKENLEQDPAKRKAFDTEADSLYGLLPCGREKITGIGIASFGPLDMKRGNWTYR